jgi:hypothetical protein
MENHKLYIVLHTISFYILAFTLITEKGTHD